VKTTKKRRVLRKVSLVVLAIVAVLGPKWRIHYYAHLSSFGDAPRFVGRGTPIGAVGTTGNARGKPPHLHYTILSLLPLPWHYQAGTQGWRRMFYLDPGQAIGARP
jgi:murein DD-endopeptidase MepM/ murein hydrolase activator NlpD